MAPSTASASSPLQAIDHVGGISAAWMFSVGDLGLQVPDITSSFSPLRYETSPAAYDTQNLRVRIKDASGDRRILLDGIEEIAEYDTTTGERIKRYDHDPSRVDGLLAQKSSGGQKLNAYSDALGSVYGLVDAQGNAQAKYSYDVYGARTASLENVGTDWGFTGRRFDGATGLGYYRNRYLNSENGAWTQADPAGMPDGPNRYWYVNGWVASATDPSGQFPWMDESVHGFIRPFLDVSMRTAMVYLQTLSVPFVYSKPTSTFLGIVTSPGWSKTFDWAERHIYMGAFALGVRISYCETNSSVPNAIATTAQESVGGGYHIVVSPAAFYEGANTSKMASIIAHELIHVALWSHPDARERVRVPRTVGVVRETSGPSSGRYIADEFENSLTEVAAYMGEAEIGILNPAQLRVQM